MGLFKPSPLAAEIADLMLRDPEGWRVEHYRAEHKATGLSIWIANGLSFVSVASCPEVRFDWRSKAHIWSAVQGLSRGTWVKRIAAHKSGATRLRAVS